MYKLTIIVAIAIGLMSFAPQGKGGGKEGHSEKSSKGGSNEKMKTSPSEKNVKNNESRSVKNFIVTNDQHGNKGNKGSNGGSKNQGGSHDKGSKGGHEKGKQSNPFGAKPSKGHDQGGGKSHKGNGPDFGKKDKGNHASGKHNNGKHDKGNNKAFNHANGKYPKAFKGKNGKMHYDKKHPNFGYIYISTHGFYSDKNYGQWRSRQARNKHKNYHPYYEYEAIEGFNLIIGRNNFLFTETDYKINLINVQLAKKRKSNAITVVQYNTYAQRIEVLQRRRAALEINIVL